MINLSNTIKKKNNKKGFTLIELIVVIAILAILAAIAIPRLGNFTSTAKVSADKATFAALESAVAIGVANGTITTNANAIVAADGKITTNPANLLEPNAAFKLDDNKSLESTIVWTVKDGVITKAPTIDDTTGIIKPAS